ncbi:MAG: OmpA family protein [Pseudomonadota bacterium]
MTFFKTPLLLGIVAALGLAGCVQQTGEPNRTGTGALVGAATGAGIGAIVGDGDATEILAGAAIGGLIGGGIGAQLDRQAAELRRQIGDDRVTIVNTGRELIVTLPQDITFATESAVVRPDLQDDIRALGNNLLNYPNTSVQVIGHTDNTGTAEFNQRLSEQRAASVANILFQQGVPGNRIITIGRGESQPIATNNSPDGRQANRRVEVIITPQR